MAKKKRKISAATRARLSQQARINFGHSKKRRKGVRKMVKRRTKRRSSTSKTSTKSLNALMIGAGLYGAGREFLSNLVSPFTSRFPLGTIGDEVALGLVSWQLAKRTKGVLRDVGIAGLGVEAARIGVALSDGSAFAATSSSSSGVGSNLQSNVFV